MHPDDFSKFISATEPDWSREKISSFWDPGYKLLRSIRRYQACKKSNGLIATLFSKYWAINHLFWSTITNCEIPLNCEIGGGLRIPHPSGIIIHPKSRIGPNCVIFQQVTLAGEVEIGGHVDVGAGAKLIGPISIGDHVQIGANAVVTQNLPSVCTAVGIPAKILSQ